MKMSNRYHEKINYSTITMINNDSLWCYDYRELQVKLNEICKNHTLKKVYVSLYNYLESEHFNENYYNFDIGAGSLIILDNVAVELGIHGEGMINFRLLNLGDIKIKNTTDYPPNNLLTTEDKFYYDMTDEFSMSLSEEKVIGITVDNIDSYPFTIEGYDNQQAELSAEANLLPNSVHFKLKNGVDFGLYADAVEYFYIKLKMLYNE